ncbi:hypothetical protein E2C01_057120 [Portunus trituberculatus]|uniref:Uncharacterized protein n=1 Tax=Portunus trituberculatus TaxID=210409 RepID=A0A5B7H1G8_PORTR|nr:hypothetical protein [Portunus trituberculatus]
MSEARNLFHHRTYVCTNCPWWWDVLERGTARAAGATVTALVDSSGRLHCCRSCKRCGTRSCAL